MNPTVRLQVAVRRLLWRDLLSVRFYVRRTRKQRLGRALTSFVQTKIPYALPLPPLPYVLVVEPTTHCNLRCIMCPSPGFESPRGYMSMEVYEKVLREAVAGSMHRIRFIGLGEPLLHPRLPEMIRRAKEGGLYTELSTNAALLTRELGGALLDAGLDEIGFSLDSADPAQYERIRKGAKYDQVIANIDGFLELCAAAPRRAPITVARMVLMDDSNVEEFSRRWSGKVDSLQFNALRVYARTGIASEIRRALKLAPEHTQLTRQVRCRQIMHKLQVAWDGSVGLCNQSSVIIGDVKTSSLQEIWQGHVLRKIRALHRNYRGHLVDVCRVCPVMQPAVDPAEGSASDARVTRRVWWSDDQIAAPPGPLVPLRLPGGRQRHRRAGTSTDLAAEGNPAPGNVPATAERRSTQTGTAS